jgi:hypothetical protein
LPEFVRERRLLATALRFSGNGFSVAGFVSDEIPNAVAAAGFAEQAPGERRGRAGEAQRRCVGDRGL